MASDIENIFQNFMADPNFIVGTPEREKKEKAWALAHERFRQTQRNNVALGMAKEDLKKEAVAGAGPDSGFSKYPAKIGDATTIENTKKFGREEIDLHKDPNRAWRVRPDTASERTGTKKELEKINPVVDAKKLFSKMEKGEMPKNKRELFKAFLQKHLIDTLEEEPMESSSEDSEMSNEAEITLDTIIEALMELKDHITQHEMDEQTGQCRSGEESFAGFPEDELEVLDSVEKGQAANTPGIRSPGPGKAKDYPGTRRYGGGYTITRPKPLKPKIDIGVKKHYTGPGGKHEHLETGQWVRPGMVTVPSKTSGGRVLVPDAKVEKKEVVHSSPVNPNPGLAEQARRDRGWEETRRLLFPKKPVQKDSQGKPGIFNETIQGSSSPVKKHEDVYMHGHEGKEKKYPFLSHLIPPAKIKTTSVKKNEKTGGFPSAGQRVVDSSNPQQPKWRPERPSEEGSPPFPKEVKKDENLGSETDISSRNPGFHRHGDLEMHAIARPHIVGYKDSAKSPLAVGLKPVKKDAKSGGYPTPEQKAADSKKIGNVFAVATREAQRQGFKDFSEGSSGKEKRGEIAEAIKRNV